ncbi:hypothetical protein JCM10207_003316 [Rhodosporidiobolus poonsookiae]
MQRQCTRCLAPLRATGSRPSPAASRAFATLSPSLSASSAPPLLPLPSLRPSPRPPAYTQKRTYALPARKQSPPAPPLVCPAEPPANPSDDFEPVEEELGEGERLEMRLTEAAVKQIERAQAAAKDPTLALRLAVESGGCHGYQYKMMVTSKREADDYRFAPQDNPTSAALLVDAASLALVKGATIDYATELIGSSFRVVGNPQSKDAGCGCGVSWELKDLD